MGSKLNEKVENLTPYNSETPKNIETKIGLSNYVIDPDNLANFVEMVQRGLLPVA